MVKFNYFVLKYFLFIYCGVQAYHDFTVSWLLDGRGLHNSMVMMDQKSNENVIKR